MYTDSRSLKAAQRGMAWGWSGGEGEGGSGGESEGEGGSEGKGGGGSGGGSQHHRSNSLTLTLSIAVTLPVTVTLPISHLPYPRRLTDAGVDVHLIRHRPRLGDRARSKSVAFQRYGVTRVHVQCLEDLPGLAAAKAGAGEGVREGGCVWEGRCGQGDC